VPKAIINKCDKLYATAINVIEIATSNKTYTRRKSALMAILKYRYDILPEPLIYLSFLFGCTNYDIRPERWLKFIDQFIDNKILSIKLTEEINTFRAINNRYHSGLEIINNFNEAIIPGHSLVENKKRATTNTDKENYKHFFRSKKFQKAEVDLLREIVKENFNVESIKTSKEVYPLVEPLIKAQGEYAIQCGIQKKAKPNDYADLLHFLYLQKKRILLTNDTNWILIAKKAGIGKLVATPKCLYNKAG